MIFDHGTHSEVRRLLAPMRGDLAACSADFLVALLAQKLASGGARNLDEVKNDVRNYGQVLESYAVSLFGASKAEDAR